MIKTLRECDHISEGLRPVVLSVSTVRSHSVTGRWQGPVELDRTRPIGKSQFWNLTINDRTLVFSVRSTQEQCPVNSGAVSDQGR